MNVFKIRFCCNTPRFMPLSVFFALTLFMSLAQAKTLAPFDAKFDVRVLGFNVGTAYQSMKCQESQCVISSVAKPPSWARAFINESAIEKIRIVQTPNEFRWIEYKKHLTRHYDDRTEKKTYTLVRRSGVEQIEYLEKNKQWPAHSLVYDMISLAYGIQFQVLNKGDLNDFYLQDEKSQQRIQFSERFKKESIDLPYADDAQTLRFAFHNDKIAAKLWLIPERNYFPGRIEIENKDEDRTIVLELKQLKRPNQ